ncbi:hypothetical protein, partial [uncultured Acetatifactor sp.]|uniref:hypothetical protein n=1 Tax=uncultured Acetatifactor sp. TaxID=1671927 RepID=UPI00262B19F9
MTSILPSLYWSRPQLAYCADPNDKDSFWIKDGNRGCLKERICIQHRCLSNVRGALDKNKATDSIEQPRRQFHGYGKL